jgi:hypothetical protein
MITNETSDVVRVLMISTNNDPEVAEYPERPWPLRRL